MVVVIIISIVAALAIPSMTVARNDREAYEDAASIMMLFREARTRAVARGAAQILSMSANGTGDRGTFQLFEAVAQNPATATVTLLGQTPVSSCKTGPAGPTAFQPLNATNGNVRLVDGVNLNSPASSIEAVADIETQLFFYASPANATQTAFPLGYVCYTPLGRSYVQLWPNAVPNFDGALPTISPIVARVTRANAANARDVLVPPNGMARLFSHTL
jgi:type II secretory pathway pseudopilin PulG